LGSIVAICAAAGVAYVVVSRRPKYDKELYESIYGKKGEIAAEDAQLDAERAEVARRAREKSDELPAASYGYATPMGLTEEDYATVAQPSGTPAAPAYTAGETLDMGKAVPAPEAPQAPESPPSPKEHAPEAAPEKKIAIRPVK